MFSRFRAVDVFAVVGDALADVGGPVSLGPLGPALGGADADADADADASREAG